MKLLKHFAIGKLFVSLWKRNNRCTTFGVWTKYGFTVEAFGLTIDIQSGGSR